MNTISRTITGIALIILGAVLIVWSVFDIKELWVFLVYGVIIFVVGFFVFFNKKEDNIEQIKK